MGLCLIMEKKICLFFFFFEMTEEECECCVVCLCLNDFTTMELRIVEMEAR